MRTTTNVKSDTVLRKGTQELRWVRPRFVTTKRGISYHPPVLAVVRKDTLVKTMRPVKNMERARFGKRLVEQNERAILRAFNLKVLPKLSLRRAVRVK